MGIDIARVAFGEFKRIEALRWGRMVEGGWCRISCVFEKNRNVKDLLNLKK